jgi:hypothetical protein
MRLTHRAIESIRREPGRSITLFITERCQVGGAHFNVDSRAEGPTIVDFERFDRILQWIATQPELEMISIIGGEPFAERRGLALTTQRLGAVGKQLVVYTNGVWAAGARVPAWIHDVLARCDCVYLSGDADPAVQVEATSLINAAREIAAAEAWLVLQVLEHESAREQAVELLNRAFGGRWDQHAEINVVTPQPHGRGAALVSPSTPVEGRSLGSCSLVQSLVLRYDGLISGCGNEAVIMGLGPPRLRRCGDSSKEIDDAIASLQADPLLRVIGGAGCSALTRHPRLRELGEQQFSTICELCWKALEQMPEGSDPELDALATLTDEEQ